MTSLHRFSEVAARRQRRERVVRLLAMSGAWLLIALVLLPILDMLRHAGGALEWRTLAGVDSIDAREAGLSGALFASVLALLPVLLIATPLGLGVAVYLEEISAGGRGAAFVNRSLQHLAMLPPVVYGLLGFGGLVVVLGLPVGTPLLAGAVLALAMLPRIVLVGQYALRQVPAAVRESGYAVGAAPLQVVSAHVLPAAAPAMLGGSFTILARALGEAAPLLLVGFMAFAAGRPNSMTEPGIPLPVLVFRWAELPAPMFAAKAAVAALVLVVAVLVLGGVGWALERRGGRA
jgi:phosphate transport system permease protein